MKDPEQASGPAPDPIRRLLVRDLVLVALVTLAVGLLSVQLELSEAVFHWTRRWEHVQLDELPAVLLALAASLAWFARRRYQDAKAELVRRRAAELQLAGLLADNRRLARSYLQVQESERKTLARELHDELGQYLNAIKTDAVSIYERSTAESSPIHRAAAAIIRHTDHLHAVVRDLVRRLRPVALDDLGLRAALEHHLAQWQQQMPHVQLSVSLEGDLDSLDEQVSLTLYRLAQEGLTNVSRHAEAQRVELRVIRKDDERNGRDEVVFELSDDGRGADPVAHRFGLGLIGMRERVEMLDGRLEVVTAAARGFTIRARMPANRTEEDPVS